MNGRRVVIVGGGFGGVTVAQHLERRLPSDVETVLISTENHLVFSPMLAEAVGRSVSPLHIVVPGRQLVNKTKWLTARVTEVDLAGSCVEYLSRGGERGSLKYDHLVLACGSVVNLDDVPGMAVYAYPLKTLGDALALGNDLIGRLEEAAVESDPVERQRLLRVVIVGGGFTGVEVAGEIADLTRRALRFYRELRHERPRIILLHRGERLLPELHADSLSAFAAAKLRQHGIEVCVRSEAREVSAQEVRLASGETIQAATVVCTVGTDTNPLIASLRLPLEKGRLRTEPDMRVVGTQNVWALGDCAAVPNQWDGQISPQTAQYATRQAKQLARNLHQVLHNQPTRPFFYRPLGMLASLGRHNAVAEILGLKLSGFPAWFLWRGLYLAKLPTLRRKIEVAIDWAWQVLFPPNIVQLQLARTNRVGKAHYAAGEFVCHKGQPGDQFYIVESGIAGVYLDENAPPVTVLKPGDHFGEGALLSAEAAGVHVVSVKAETPLDLLTLGRDDIQQLSETLLVLRRQIEQSLTGRFAG